MSKLKTWTWTKYIWSPEEKRSLQQMVIVTAASQKRAAELIGTTIGDFRNYACGPIGPDHKFCAEGRASEESMWLKSGSEFQEENVTWTRLTESKTEKKQS